MVEIINLRTCKDWGKPGDIKIDRTTIFGNPFPIGHCIENGKHKHYTRDSCIERYEQYLIADQLIIINGKQYNPIKVKQELKNLSNNPPLRIGCWCFPLNCHGSIILKYIERQQSHLNKFYK
jgi:hypothetical protein